MSGWASPPDRSASEVAQPAGPYFPDYGFLSLIDSTHRRNAASSSTCRAVSSSRGRRSGMLPRTFISGRPREEASVRGFRRVCFVHRLTVNLQPLHTTVAQLRAPRRMLIASVKGPRVCRKPVPAPPRPGVFPSHSSRLRGPSDQRRPRIDRGFEYGLDARKSAVRIVAAGVSSFPGTWRAR